MALNVFDLVTQLAPKLRIKTHSAKSFAVIDTETTGVIPMMDRIIEIAIINVDVKGKIENEFVTLVNPSRDLGPTNKHGIKAKDVSGAPTFEEVAGDIVERLKDRIIIGHNVTFDIGMLNAEFQRLESSFLNIPHICTRRLAYEFGPSSRKLGECCAFFGFEIARAHSALEDARATHRLYLEYMKLAEQQGVSHFSELKAYRREEDITVWPSFTPSGKVKVRSEIHSDIHPFLSNVISSLPDTGNSDFAAYFSVLDRALEDRILTSDEVIALQSLAESAGFSKKGILDAHEEYFRHLVRTALEDGVITENELEDIQAVGALLGLNKQRQSELIDLVKAIAPTLKNLVNEIVTSPIPQQQITDSGLSSEPQIKYSGHDLVGKRVCFTGALASKVNGCEISREMAIRLAQDCGLVPTTGVSKKTDILVVADPYTMSGKAKKAREYGIRIVADRVFWKMLGVKVD